MPHLFLHSPVRLKPHLTGSAGGPGWRSLEGRDVLDWMYSHFLLYASATLIGAILLACVLFPLFMRVLDHFFPAPEDRDDPTWD